MDLVQRMSLPATSIATQMAVASFGVGFIRADDKLTRFAAVALLLSVTYGATQVSPSRFESPIWYSIFYASSFNIVLSGSERLLLSRWSWEDGGPRYWGNTKANRPPSGPAPRGQKIPWRNKPDTFWNRLKLGADSQFAIRGIGRPWKVKNVPAFSYKDSSYVPSRTRWIFYAFVRSAILFAISDFFSAQPAPPPSQMAVIFAPDKVPFFRPLLEGDLSPISADALLARVSTTIIYWFNAYTLLQICHAVFAGMFVLTHFDEPAVFPPQFGSVTNAYSIRTWWSEWWHQNLRSTFEGYSRLVVEDVLHLKRGTFLSRYMKIFVPFIVSGIMHLSSDYGLGVSVAESGAVGFFLMEGVGIMIEDGIVALYHRFGGAEHKGKPPLKLRVLGYIWVLLFQCWVTPRWSYPLIKNSRPGDNPYFVTLFERK